MFVLTHVEHVKAINKVNPNVEVVGNIKNATTKVLCRCKICHHEWKAAPYNLKKGSGCPVCAKVKVANKRRLAHTEHVSAITKVNPNVDILEEIRNVNKKVKCRCKVCHYEWTPLPTNLKKGRGCPRCAGVVKTSEERVNKIQKVNPDVEILEEIINAHTPVLCRCMICGNKWKAAASNLERGGGCPCCAGKQQSKRQTLSETDQLAAIKAVNPNIKILGKVARNNDPVLCKCLVCGHEWDATPGGIKHGSGCPKCAKKGFLAHDLGNLYVMVDDLNVPTMMKIGVSVDEGERSKRVLRSAHKAGVSIPALYVAKTWEGPTELMQRIEGMMHDKYAEWNIKFLTKFDGCTEFFYYNPDTAGVFDVINDFYYTVVNQF